MAEARIWRKRFGGGMRQVGILAAAGLYALDHHVERLADDHARARRRGRRRWPRRLPAPSTSRTVQTNIVILDVAAVGWTSAAFVDGRPRRRHRTYAVSPGAVRLVWHLDVDDAGTDVAIDVLTALLRSAPAA